MVAKMHSFEYCPSTICAATRPRMQSEEVLRNGQDCKVLQLARALYCSNRLLFPPVNDQCAQNITQYPRYQCYIIILSKN